MSIASLLLQIFKNFWASIPSASQQTAMPSLISGHSLATYQLESSAGETLAVDLFCQKDYPYLGLIMDVMMSAVI